jgi:hypothetical protein
MAKGKGREAVLMIIYSATVECEICGAYVEGLSGRPEHIEMDMEDEQWYKANSGYWYCPRHADAERAADEAQPMAEKPNRSIYREE